jgi:hypothetical protein
MWIDRISIGVPADSLGIGGAAGVVVGVGVFGVSVAEGDGDTLVGVFVGVAGDGHGVGVRLACGRLAEQEATSHAAATRTSTGIPRE